MTKEKNSVVQILRKKMFLQIEIEFSKNTRIKKMFFKKITEIRRPTRLRRADHALAPAAKPE